MNLPSDYLAFIEEHDGEGFFPSAESYLALWKVEDLLELNAAYEVNRWAPGLLVFGSDGGGEAYGFDTRSPSWPIVQVPFIGMEWAVAIPVGNSFSEFLQSLKGPSS